MVINPPGPTVIGYEVAGVITIPGDVPGVAVLPEPPAVKLPGFPGFRFATTFDAIDAPPGLPAPPGPHRPPAPPPPPDATV
jgi:hypothetical protein